MTEPSEPRLLSRDFRAATVRKRPQTIELVIP
jgi:hypothetical protein